jgi:DNA-binding MarR family transcriptional regulator
MARKQPPARIHNIYRTVEQHPGERPGGIARILKINRSEVTRALPSLEEQGHFLSEDEHGRLWPYRSEDK